MGLRPWRLWRELGAEHGVNGSRLNLLLMVWGLAALVILHFGLGAIWVPPWRLFHRTVRPGEWFWAMAWPHGTTFADFVNYTVFPATASAVMGLLPMLLMWVGIAWFARLRKIQNTPGILKRGVVYAMAPGLLAALLFHFMPLVQVTAENELLINVSVLIYVLALVSYPFFVANYWRHFATHATRLPRPLLSVVGLLVCAIVVTVITIMLIEMMRAFLFPSPLAEFEAIMDMMRERRSD